MDLVTILALISLILAIVSLFVTAHTFRLLVAAVVLLAIALLVTGGSIGT